MKIYDASDKLIVDTYIEDTSNLVRAVMQPSVLTLNFTLDQSVDVGAGAYVDFEGKRYRVYDAIKVTKIATGWFEYSIVLKDEAAALTEILIKDESVPARTHFAMTGTPRDFAMLLSRNMGERWSVGACIDRADKTIAFAGHTCYDALGMIAREFDTEWVVEEHSIAFRKVEISELEPLPLSYGKGNGFCSGVSRVTTSRRQIGRLYVAGGERNIDSSTYMARALLLPRAQQLSYMSESYRSNEHGTYVERVGNTLKAQGSLEAKHIYPRRVGVVSGVIVVDADKHLYNIVDSSISEDLNYSDYRIAGEKAVIKFESGLLAGREFDIVQTDQALTGYKHASRTFELVPQEHDEQMMPSNAFMPRVGDRYAIFGISLPQNYIVAAELELMREAIKYLYDNEQPEYTFTGKLDGVWSKSRWLEIGGYLQPGGKVLFSDPEFHPDGTEIRIISMKQYVNNPCAPEITLSNARVSGSLSSALAKLEAQEVLALDRHKTVMRYAERGYREATETAAKLVGAVAGYTDGIRPITAHMMQLLAGSHVLQFRFVNSKVSPQAITPPLKYDKDTGVVRLDRTIVQHMTIGISDIKPNRSTGEYRFWDVASYISPPIKNEKAYYLYVRAAKSNAQAVAMLSEEALEFEGGAHYNLLVGIYNSVNADGERAWAPLYGFTEVLPGQVTTGLLRSTDGQSYLDLARGAMRLGDKLRYNVDGDGALEIEGVVVQLTEQQKQELKGTDGKNPFYFDLWFTGSFVDDVATDVGIQYTLTYNGVVVEPYDYDKMLFRRYVYTDRISDPIQVMPNMKINDTLDGVVAIEIEANVEYQSQRYVMRKRLNNNRKGKDGVDGESIKGDKGDPGDKGNDGKQGGFASIPVTYNSNDTYVGSDEYSSVVIHDGKMYRAKIDVPLNTPPPNSFYWQQISSFVDLGITNLYAKYLFAQQAFVDALKAQEIEASYIKAGASSYAENGYYVMINRDGSGQLAGGMLKFDREGVLMRTDSWQRFSFRRWAESKPYAYIGGVVPSVELLQGWQHQSPSGSETISVQIYRNYSSQQQAHLARLVVPGNKLGTQIRPSVSCSFNQGTFGNMQVRLGVTISHGKEVFTSFSEWIRAEDHPDGYIFPNVAPAFVVTKEGSASIGAFIDVRSGDYGTRMTISGSLSYVVDQGAGEAGLGIAEDGVYINRGADKYLHISDNGVRVGEGMNIPMVLARGTITGYTSGNSITNWQHYKGFPMSVSRPDGAGEPLLTHNIGHENYQVICTPSRGNTTIAVRSKNSNIIKFEQKEGSQYRDDAFDFVVIGVAK